MEVAPICQQVIMPVCLSHLKPILLILIVMQLANVGIYEAIAKPMNVLSALKSSNALLYVLASNFAKENSFDDVVLLNAAGRVCEATSSNLFVIKDEKIFTPSVTEGCVEGVLRTVLFEPFQDGRNANHSRTISNG
jgi:branched-subunit amino acid aminotransferase/4-amino-4-deoxychorismate lyase